MKIKTLLFLFFMLAAQVVNACPVCEKKQPAITKGITHGTGPDSNWDWVIIGAITIITILTLVYSIKYLIKPGEKTTNHVKNSIFSN